MKILKLSPYFFPEHVSSTHLSKNLKEGYLKAGFYIENYVPIPTRGVDYETRKKYSKIKYEELEDGHVIVHRFFMFQEGKNSIQRAIRYILVNFLQYLKGTKAKDIDVIMGASTPPTQGLLCGLVKRKLSKRYGKKVPFVYNLQDIFPDSLVHTGLTRKGSLLWKIGRRIEDFTYRNADKIIVISEDFKKNIMAKGVSEDKIVVVPNWVDTDDVYPIARKDNVLIERYHLDPNKFYITYSGNIGYTQNMDMLLDAAKEITNGDIRFILIGEGAAKVEVEKRVREENIKNVIMLPFQPYADIAHVFSLGDAGLIISKPGVSNNSVPSKTWSIMSAARPVIASFDEESELCSIIRRSESGLCVPPDDPQALKNAILKLYSDKEKRIKFGKNGREFVLKNLTRETGTAKYVQVVREVFEKSSY